MSATRPTGSAGVLYDSLRGRTGINVFPHRSRNIARIAQVDHFKIAVSSTRRNIEIRKLSRIMTAANEEPG